MLLPTYKLLALLLVPVLPMMLWPHPAMLAAAATYDAGLLLWAVLDAWRTPRPRQIQISRQAPGRLSLGQWGQCGWEIVNRSVWPVALILRDDLPVGLQSRGAAAQALIRPNAVAQLRYELLAPRRGRYELGDIHLRYRSPWGLSWRQVRQNCQSAIKVYPEAVHLARYELAARKHRQSEVGLSSARQRGRGSIFESLRDYLPGDDLGDVAWKATAHRGRLISRNYHADSSQNLLLVLDCGRLMTTQLDERSRLDYAIQAALLLTWVAMKQGDYIGLLAFSDRIEAHLPPTRGRSALVQMNEGLYRLQPRLVEPDFDQACRLLSLQQRKRSLIVFFTDVVSPEASGALLAYAARFARQHLPLCVAMGNPQVKTLANSQPADVEGALSQVVALEMQRKREHALARMRASGVDVLDADPRQLTPLLLDRYLRLKQRRM